MNVILEQIIKEKIDLLVNFIVEQNANANKENIYHKIYQLNILTDDQKRNGSKAVVNRRTIIDSIQDHSTVIKVRRSQHSNYVLYPPDDSRFDDLIENKLVMNINTQTIIGVENSDGEIDPLNKNHI